MAAHSVDVAEAGIAFVDGEGAHLPQVSKSKKHETFEGSLVTGKENA